MLPRKDIFAIKYNQDIIVNLKWIPDEVHAYDKLLGVWRYEYIYSLFSLSEFRYLPFKIETNSTVDRCAIVLESKLDIFYNIMNNNYTKITLDKNTKITQNFNRVCMIM